MNQELLIKKINDWCLENDIHPPFISITPAEGNSKGILNARINIMFDITFRDKITIKRPEKVETDNYAPVPSAPYTKKTTQWWKFW